MKFIGMRRALPFHPKSFVEAYGVNHQGIAFPMTDRVSVVAWNEIFRMRTTIQINHAKGLWSVFIENVDCLHLRDIDKLRTAGRDELARPTRGFAASVRFKQVGFAILI